MMIELPKLPYEMNALEPHISQRTLEFHYGKHHAAYVNNLNKLIAGTPFEGKSLEEIIKNSNGGIFNNAAQVWNHTFYWNCMTPNPAKDKPKGKLMEAIIRDFGSFDEFKTKFIEKCATLFGSGWTWLVADKDGKLSIVQTSNAQTPLTDDLKPLLVCDVWEHAYYLDYQNVRANYLNEFWAVINWEFVESNF
ncbi:MAG: superoxide dismutase [Bacteroidales bacterium]|nr:superoxide dismutase [Bacteroidales bacterium]